MCVVVLKVPSGFATVSAVGVVKAVIGTGFCSALACWRAFGSAPVGDVAAVTECAPGAASGVAASAAPGVASMSPSDVIKPTVRLVC